MVRGPQPHGLHLDGHRAGGEGAQREGHPHDEVDGHIAGDGVPDGALQLAGGQVDAVDPSALHRAGRPAPLRRADQHEQVGAQILQALGDRDGPVVQILHEHAGAEIVVREPVDGVAAQVQVALVELPHAADEGGHGRPCRPCFSRRPHRHRC